MPHWPILGVSLPQATEVGLGFAVKSLAVFALPLSARPFSAVLSFDVVAFSARSVVVVNVFLD